MRLVPLLGVAACLAAQPKVRGWEEKVTIPTYTLQSPNPYPDFHVYAGGGGKRPVYPYPSLDDVSSVKADQAWNAVFLENEYLKVTVMPGLGGKVYSIFDKTAKREVLYTNRVVKYLLKDGIAWTVGGIEWNFPDAHQPTSASPVDYVLRENRDGSAEIAVGDTERIQGLQWQVTIRLRPGIRMVETETVLNNRAPIPARYWFWSRAVAQANGDLRFVFPARAWFPYAGEPFRPFPNADGVDYSLWRQTPEPQDLFAWHSQRDFLGIYYEKPDWGVVHVGDHRLLPGKKLWIAGTSGIVSTQSATDSDGPFVELQAGRSENQAAYSSLSPLHADRFLEYWFPVDHLGGRWSEATSDGVLRLVREPGKAQVAVAMNSAIEGAEVVLEDGAGRVLETWKTDFKPGVPFRAERNVPGEGAVGIRVRSGAKENVKEWLRYRSDLPIDGNFSFKPPQSEPRQTGMAQAAYDLGQKSERESADLAALDNYRRAAAADPSYLQPRLALGVAYLRNGDDKTSTVFLLDALRISPASDEAHYYYGLVLRASGNLDEAKKQLTLAAASGLWGDSAREVLGEIAMSQSAWPSAIEQLSLSTSPKARTYLAVAYRVSGNAVRAKSLVSQLRQELPLDYLVLNEAALGGDAAAEKDLWRLLDRQPDHVLDLVYDYAVVKRPEARAVLQKAILRSKPDAMWSYSLGWLLEAAGDIPSARVQYETGARADPALVFPHRVMEMDILGKALAALPPKSPEWARTAYYLGNTLAAHYRPGEAELQWRAAAPYDRGNPYVHYALSSHAQYTDNNRERMTELDRAVAAAPNDYRLYLLRDSLLAGAQTSDAQRLALLDAAPVSIKQDSHLFLVLARLYAKNGRLNDALALLEKSGPSGSAEAAGAYRDTQEALAQSLTRAGRYKDAADALSKSLLGPPDAQTNALDAARNARPKALLEVAALLDRAGKRDEALTWVKRAAEWPAGAALNPKDVSIEDEYHRAEALARLHRFPEARAGMERVVERDVSGELGRQAVLTIRHWKAAGVIP